jgi:hypothetical protein
MARQTETAFFVASAMFESSPFKVSFTEVKLCGVSTPLGPKSPSASV